MPLDVYDEGRLAYVEGKHFDQNPYGYNTEDYWDWDAGWGDEDSEYCTDNYHYYHG